MLWCAPMAVRSSLPTTRRGVAFAGLFASLCAAIACGDRRAESSASGDPASTGDPAALDVIEPELPPDMPLDRVVAVKAKRYAAGLVAEGAPLRGTLNEGQRADHLTVLRGGHCYRLLGAAAIEVEDMDLFLFDPNGVQLQQDAAQDRFPVLGMQADICPAYSGAYRLQVFMYKGGGAYELQAYVTP